eukprot:TRINITY_DN22245_c0_g1_i4.p1 TRINITY_DN22245_c0_g1~~TRINITY_DN22245_c0_g1_i4.p1  ORF type:complete len:1478 (-),score=330.24 TRINITY_DN22245_c0_g1_i4:587-5020(-)
MAAAGIGVSDALVEQACTRYFEILRGEVAREVPGSGQIAFVFRSSGLAFLVGGSHAGSDEGSRPASDPAVQATATRLEIASYQTLLDLAARRLNMPGALLKRQLVIKGGQQAFRQIAGPLQKAGKAFMEEVRESGSPLLQVVDATSGGGSFSRSMSSSSWMPNAASSTCLRCQRTFNLLRRRHHCRACGDLICRSCSVGTGEERRCTSCTGGPLLHSASAPPGGALPSLLGSSQAAGASETKDVAHPDGYVNDYVQQKLLPRLHAPISVATPSVIERHLLARVKQLQELAETAEKGKPSVVATLMFFSGKIAAAVLQATLAVFLVCAILAPAEEWIAVSELAGSASRSLCSALWLSSVICRGQDLDPLSRLVLWLYGFVAGPRWHVALGSFALAIVLGGLRKRYAALALLVALCRCTAFLAASHALSTGWEAVALLGVPAWLPGIAFHTPGILEQAALIPKTAVVLITMGLGLAWAWRNTRLSRFFRIYATAAVPITTFTVLKIVRKALFLTEDQANKYLYDVADQFMAPFVSGQCMQLRSVFTKMGQVIGTRADFMPRHWITAFKCLFDDAPCDTDTYVRKILEKEFGKKVDELFENFDFKPLASASIAQVHKAVHKATGQKVAIKVQHENIDSIFRADFQDLLRILRFCRWWSGDPDMWDTPVRFAENWTKVLERELNFNCEADNLHKMRAALAAASVQATVPAPVDGLIGRRCFAMEFLEGFKITDECRLAQEGVDTKTLLAKLAHSYAAQLMELGMMNADPHPGNVFVSVTRGSKTAEGTAELVLLDFGMTVDIAEKTRLGYCQLLMALQEMSICGVQDALSSIGYETSQSSSNPERDMQFWAFMMRDTGSQDSQRADGKEFFKKRQEQMKQDREAAEAKAGAVTKKEKKAVQKEMKGRYIKSFPDELMWILRVLGMFRGLCTQLSVELPYLEIFGLHARRVLLARFPAPQRALKALQQERSASALRAAANDSAIQRLQTALRTDLQRRCRECPGLGLQVCVLVGKDLAVSEFAGVLGMCDPRPVQETTVFPLHDLSKTLVALAVRHEVRRENLSYRSKVMLPAFEQAAESTGSAASPKKAKAKTVVTAEVERQQVPTELDVRLCEVLSNTAWKSMAALMKLQSTPLAVVRQPAQWLPRAQEALKETSDSAHVGSGGERPAHYASGFGAGGVLEAMLLCTTAGSKGCSSALDARENGGHGLAQSLEKLLKQVGGVPGSVKLGASAAGKDSGRFGLQESASLSSALLTEVQAMMGMDSASGTAAASPGAALRSSPSQQAATADAAAEASSPAGDAAPDFNMQQALAGVDVCVGNVVRSSAEAAQTQAAPTARTAQEQFCADLAGFASARGLAEVLARDSLQPTHQQEKAFAALQGKQVLPSSGPMSMLGALNMSGQRVWDGRGFEVLAGGAALGGTGIGGSLSVAAQFHPSGSQGAGKEVTVVVLSNRLSLESQHGVELAELVSQYLQLPSFRG